MKKLALSAAPAASRPAAAAAGLAPAAVYEPPRGASKVQQPPTKVCQRTADVQNFHS